MPPICGNNCGGNNGGNASLICAPAVSALEAELSLASAEALAALDLWQLRCGEILTIRDAGGNYYRARLKSQDAEGAVVVPFERLDNPESHVEIHVYQALPQKERFEWVLQKLTEIGAVRIVPFVSQHSISLEERDAVQIKSHRWPQVVRKAACQCRRALIPELAPVLSWEDALADISTCEVRLMLAEKGGSWSMREALNLTRVHQVALMVGPEGGFAAQEVEMARNHGVLPVSLGARILRTETAALVGATLIQGMVGDYV